MKPVAAPRSPLGTGPELVACAAALALAEAVLDRVARSPEPGPVQADTPRKSRERLAPAATPRRGGHGAIGAGGGFKLAKAAWEARAVNPHRGRALHGRNHREDDTRDVHRIALAARYGVPEFGGRAGPCALTQDDGAGLRRVLVRVRPRTWSSPSRASGSKQTIKYRKGNLS